LIAKVGLSVEGEGASAFTGKFGIPRGRDEVSVLACDFDLSRERKEIPVVGSRILLSLVNGST